VLRIRFGALALYGAALDLQRAASTILGRDLQAVLLSLRSFERAGTALTVGGAPARYCSSNSLARARRAGRPVHSGRTGCRVPGPRRRFRARYCAPPLRGGGRESAIHEEGVDGQIIALAGDDFRGYLLDKNAGAAAGTGGRISNSDVIVPGAGT